MPSPYRTPLPLQTVHLRFPEPPQPEQRSLRNTCLPFLSMPDLRMVPLPLQLKQRAAVSAFDRSTLERRGIVFVWRRLMS